MYRSPSSNRTCRFPASGSPTRVAAEPTQEVDGAPLEVAEAIAVQTRRETLATPKRMTTPLAPIPQEAAEADMQVVVERAESPTWVPVTEVRRPAAQQRVDRRDGVGQRRLHPRRGQPAQFFSHARLRPLRRDDVEIASTPAEAVVVVPKHEAQEIEARPRYAQAYHPRLGSVHGQPKVPFERPFNPRDDAWPHPPREHDEVVGVPHQSRLRKLRGTVLVVKRTVEIVEVDIGQQRRDHAALRRPLPRMRRASPTLVVFVHDGTPQPQTNQMQHRTVRNPPLELLHQSRVVDGVEVARQVRVVHLPPTRLERRLHLVERLMRVPSRTESVRTRLEVRLEDQFDHQEHRHLRDAVPHRRNAQRAEPAIRLRNVDAAHGLRTIRARSQRLGEVVEKRAHPARPSFDVVQRHAITPRRTLILPDPLPRRLEHVATIDPVEQRVEPKPWFLLRLASQFPSQQGDTLRQVGFRHEALGFPVRDGASVAQAAAPFVDENMREVRPLRSTAITPLPRYYEPVRLPAAVDVPLWIPARRWSCGHDHHAGSPRTLDDSVDARPPQSSRTARWVRLLVASPSMAGFSTSARLAAVIGFNETESGSRTLDSRLRSPTAPAVDARVHARTRTRSVSRDWLPVHAGPLLHAERAIHMADSFQSARVARVGLARPEKRSGFDARRVAASCGRNRARTRIAKDRTATRVRARFGPRGWPASQANTSNPPRHFRSFSVSPCDPVASVAPVNFGGASGAGSLSAI